MFQHRDARRNWVENVNGQHDHEASKKVLFQFIRFLNNDEKSIAVLLNAV